MKALNLGCLVMGLVFASLIAAAFFLVIVAVAMGLHST